ncbi:hypothetical protein QJS04_geneDACA011355 [Acorus gramineus]|uniref:Uncharacterized protein n=1 Tax=Acorus gramineus TaxID=55184 RepID=A0AAV9ANB3_ACOGR|nr:hypothetical protein QJS04_geneDACA011355 [Acorus gramineus]
MAISRFLRRAAPMAARAVSGGAPRRNYRSVLLHPLRAGVGSSSGGMVGRNYLFAPRAFFSAAAAARDQSLLKVIESEIKCAEESDEGNQVEEFPEEFPFEIQDNPKTQTVTLKRDYQGEVITVEVSMPNLVTGEDNNDADDNDESSDQSCLPLVVSVSKGNGPCLEFGCSAYPEEVVIDSLSVKEPSTTEDQLAYEGPEFSDLDENLQKAFHKYLEIRGITPSITNFLHEYMINKDSREYLDWMKSLKEFIEK